MGSHPLNLAVRFLLELIALFVIGLWGKQLNEGWMGYAGAIILPLLAAAIWGIFAVPDDPSRSGEAPVPVGGIIRLAIEGLVFGVAIFALMKLEYHSYSSIYACLVVLHYLISYDRIWWLINK